jgi:geranylgeranyl diphosphate synthase type II
MRYAVFPRGARVRPRLCLAVAAACGDDRSPLADSAAAAIELLHCASLVHDDLPCFDDAATRRGKPSLHVAFGEPLAVLAGDALIVLAFQLLARSGRVAPERLGPVLMAVGDSVGVPHGIVAGQAWECEPSTDLSVYQQEKTGSLFASAALAGALSAGAPAATWQLVGERLGEAYQVADDISDAVASDEALGKPAGQDAAHGRPNAVETFGLGGALRRLERLAAEAAAAVPPCPGQAALQGLIRQEAERLLPKRFTAAAA